MADEPFVGQLLLFPFPFPPKGWALCNGQILSINANQALFSLLGTTYGGDGTTTFALPDLRSRITVGVDQGGTAILGQKLGLENVSLVTQQIPLHSHNVNCLSSTGNTTNGSPSNALPAASITNGDKLYVSTTNAAMNSAMIGNNNGGQAHSNLQPYLCMNWCIALVGIFPSRN